MDRYSKYQFFKKTKPLSPLSTYARLFCLENLLHCFFLFLLFSHRCFIWCLLNIWVERSCSLQQQNVAVIIMEMF